jgi:hypothetical protein
LSSARNQEAGLAHRTRVKTPFRRSALLLSAALLIGAVASASIAIATAKTLGAKAPPSSKAQKTCGSKELFGHTFSVWVVGKPLTCAKARQISSASCGIKLHRKWSCFSFPVDKPFLAWFPTKELYRRHWSTTIALRRYPCADARVSPQLFEPLGRGFPTRRQMLADDLIRCHLLKDKNTTEVEAEIGAPEEIETSQGKTSFVYALGRERDSFIQIDNESLLVEFANGAVASVSIFQD